MKGGVKMADVFIGYAAEDEKIARMLSDNLNAIGISVWYAAKDLEPGDAFVVSIAEEIKRCSAFVLILSKSGIRSAFLLDEMRYVAKLRRKSSGMMFSFPLVIDREGKTALSKRIITGNLWFDATIPPLQDRLREFAQLIRERLNKPQESAS